VNTIVRLCAMLLLVQSLLPSAARADTVLSILPASTSVTAGDNFNLNVAISGVSDLYGYQFDLQFDPSMFAAVSSSEGSFLQSGGPTFFIPGVNDNVNGTIAATANTLVSAVPGVSGSGDLVDFTFQALRSGMGSITASGMEFIDSTFNEIDLHATGASVSVASAVLTAPEIDPTSTASAVTLLIGSLLLLHGRKAAMPPKQDVCLSPAGRRRRSRN
jgi:hypothetical protein